MIFSLLLRRLFVLVFLVCSTLTIAVPPAAAVDCQYDRDSYECRDEGKQLKRERFLEVVKDGDGYKDCYECDLFGVDLSGADLRNANLSMADLTRANLSGADLTDAELYEAVLYRANLKDAKVTPDQLRSADLYQTTLPNGTVSNTPNF